MAKLHVVAALTIALAFVFACGVMAIAPGDTSPSFDLKDQFGKSWKSSDVRNSVVVIVAANPDSGRAMGPWVDNLKTRYGSKIDLIGLMDLHTVPGIGRGIARSRIRGETKDPLMLDFDGATARAYSVNSKYPVVVVIDKNGVVQSVQKSVFTNDAFSATTAAIDKSLK